MPEPTLSELIQKHLDSTISADEFRELQRRITADPLAADAFIKACRMDAMLTEQFVESKRMEESAVVAQRAIDQLSHGDDYIPMPPRHTRWPLGAIALAAAILIATGVGVWIALQPDKPIPLPYQFGPTHQLVSGRALIDGEEGKPIKNGSRIDVLDEAATIALADGSRLELSRASSAIVRGGVGDLRQVIALLSGGGKFQVAKGDNRFQIETPIGPVIVLGTEFELQLQRHDEELWKGEEDMRIREIMTLSVIVLGGSVQVEVGGEQVILGAGENRIFADEPRRDQPREEPRKNDFTGRFVSYNATNSTLIVTGGERRDTVTFAVARDAKVTIKGAAGKLADLNEKHMLQLTLNADRSTVLEIRGDERAVEQPRRDQPADRRMILSVDADKRTITIKGERENTSFPVSKEARFAVNGREAKLADVKPGVLSLVQFSDDQKTVVAITQGDRRVDGDRPRDAERGLRGQLEKYDAKAGTITVVQRRDGGGEQRTTFTVNKDTKLTMDGVRDLKLTDIPENMWIAVHANDEKVATAIHVMPRPVRRIVLEVNAEKNTITFRAEREHLTFPVSKDVAITNDTERRVDAERPPAKLSDLKQGTVCFVTMSLDGKTVVAISFRGFQTDRPILKDGEPRKEGDRPPVKDSERKKEVDRPPLKDGEPRKDAPREGDRKDGDARRTGTIIGELKARSDTKDGKNTMIEVLAPGEEKARSYFVNHEPAIKGPNPDVLKLVRAAKVGDRVEFEWVGTNHGPAITKFKVLPRRDEK